jgi:hypothetical protein
MSTQVFTLPLSTVLGDTVTPSLLPTQAVGARDKEVWAVVPAAALSWHCVTLPSGLQKQKNRLLPALQAVRIVVDQIRLDGILHDHAFSTTSLTLV